MRRNSLSGRCRFFRSSKAAYTYSSGLVPSTPVPRGRRGSFGAALRALLASVKYDTIKSLPDKPGDIKPLLFLLQGTPPSDSFDDEVNELAKLVMSNSLNVFGISLDSAVCPILRRITKTVLLADPSLPLAIPAMFEWILTSIKAGVRFAAGISAGSIALPPLPQGIRHC